MKTQNRFYKFINFCNLMRRRNRQLIPMIINLLAHLNSGKTINKRKSIKYNLRKISIVIVTNVYFPYLGGISTYVRNLEGGLRQRGYEVTVCAFPSSLIMKEDEISSRFVYRIVHEIFVLFFIISTLLKIIRIRLQERYVIINSQSASFCMAVGVIARLFNTRTVHTFHSPINRCTIRLRILLPFLHELVFVSEEHKDQYIKICATPEDIKIIPGGADCQFFRPPTAEEREKAKSEVAQRIGFKSSPGPIITLIGRVLSEKGVDVFLEAAKLVTKVKPDTIFIAVGPTNQSKSQIAYVEDLQRRTDKNLNFFILGREDMNGIRLFYHASTITIYPSLLNEASPLVPIESMATGVPVIASRIGGLKSRIEDTVTGYLIEPGDAKGLAEKMIDLLEDQEKVARMGLKSRELAVSNYSVENMLDKYEELYRKMLS